MTITNNLGLPLPLVRAVENDTYNNGGTWSATTLLRPAQAIALSRAHAAEITEDAADRIWALMGQIGHSIIERGASGLDDNWIAERRFYTDALGERISGQADIVDIENKTVFDYKFTSGWAVMDAQKGGKGDWQLQLSLLAMLAREGRYLIPALGLPDEWVEVRGYPTEITHGKIVAVVRDWTESAAARNPDWPQQKVAVIDMQILPDAEVRLWAASRLEVIKRALAGEDVPCTDEERWLRPGKWAVYKGANIKAAKLADSEDELSAWIFANQAKVGAGYRIEERKGKFARCESYCSAAPFCPQHLREQAAEAFAGISETA